MKSEEVKIKIVRKGLKAVREFEYAPGYVFTDDPGCRDYDWLVVYDEMPREEHLACPRERTILATCEPVSVKRYSKAYTRQFAYLLTNRPREAENHPGYRLGRGYYKWFIDRSFEEARDTVIPEKTKLVSAVCSSKQMKHTRHFDRFRLIGELARAIPELEWFGHGVKGFGKKYEVMDPYKYHVTVENHVAAHHWTEKLSDAFLSECLPFYAGDPAITEVFPAEAVVPIPIDDPDAAIRIVKDAIAAGEYEKRRAAILEAKRLILTKYNFWAQVLEVVKSEGGASADRGNGTKGDFVIYPRKALRKRSLSAAIEDAVGHIRQFFGW